MARGMKTNTSGNEIDVQQKTVTPYKQGRTIYPDSAFQAMSSVVLENVPKRIVSNEYGDTVYIGTENV